VLRAHPIPPQAAQAARETEAAVRNLAPVAAMIALALPNRACGTVIVNVHAVNAKNEPVPDSAPAVILLQGKTKTNLDKTMDGTMGVTIKQMYWTLGQYDQVCIFEAPDDETAASVLLAADMLGNKMDEVAPYQSERRSTDEPHKVMVIDPNNGDEQVAHRIADGRGPQRPESRE
jgi:hypothetical protein